MFELIRTRASNCERRKKGMVDMLTFHMGSVAVRCQYLVNE